MQNRYTHRAHASETIKIRKQARTKTQPHVYKQYALCMHAHVQFLSSCCIINYCLIISLHQFEPIFQTGPILEMEVESQVGVNGHHWIWKFIPGMVGGDVTWETGVFPVATNLPLFWCKHQLSLLSHTK